MWIQPAECCLQTGANSIIYILAEISGRVPAEFRSSSGQASSCVPYIGQPPVLYFPRLCPTSVGDRPVSVKETSSSDCLRCTGHRPILCRAPADVFSDVVMKGLRWGSLVRARWNLAPKFKFHRAATDAVLSNKRHGFRLVFGRDRWRTHRWLMETSSTGLCDWTIILTELMSIIFVIIAINFVKNKFSEK